MADNASHGSSSNCQISPDNEIVTESSNKNIQTSPMVENQVKLDHSSTSSGSEMDEVEDYSISWSPASYWSPAHSPYPSTINEVDPGSPFWNAPTPPIHLPPKEEDESLEKEKDCVVKESLYKNKSQTHEVKNLTVISTTLQTISENSNLWTNKKHFNSSKNAYICRIPKELLFNATIHQTLKFKAHTTLPNFYIKQQLIYRSTIIDRWSFQKGLVNPEVVTIWETVISRYSKTKFFTNPMLRGPATIETQMFDGERLLHEYKARFIFI